MEFNQAASQGGDFEMYLDAVPRDGHDVHVDGRGHEVGHVVWFLIDPKDADASPFAAWCCAPTTRPATPPGTERQRQPPT